MCQIVLFLLSHSLSLPIFFAHIALIFLLITSYIVFSFLCLLLNGILLILLFLDLYTFCFRHSSWFYCFIHFFLFSPCFNYLIFSFLLTIIYLLFISILAQLFIPFLMCSSLPAVAISPINTGILIFI